MLSNPAHPSPPVAMPQPETISSRPSKVEPGGFYYHRPPSASPQAPALGASPILTSSTSSSAQQHHRHQSVPTVPHLRTQVRPQTPTRSHSRQQSQDMALTGDGRALRPSANQDTKDTKDTKDTTPKSSAASIMSVETTPKSATTQSSRFGFLSALTGRRNQNQPTRSVDDDLYNLDIEAALFPSSDSDAFSPAAFKNLQTNALGLLHKMQDAYRERVIAVQDLQADKEAQKEEMEEVELRTRNFKTQLEKMAAKASDQEQAIQQLMNELHAEKKARCEERISRDKLLAEDSRVSEDLCVDEEERKRWRKSDSTLKSELSIDTDVESGESESIFSRSRSPTVLTTVTECESLDIPAGAPAKSQASKPRTQLTTFQKIVKNISGDEGSAANGCQRCQGQDSSTAWETVSLLRDENKDLKHRVAGLEVAVEGALDAVNGLRI